MSAKGRRKGPPVPLDFFPTPPWCVDRFLDDEDMCWATGLMCEQGSLNPSFRQAVDTPLRILEPSVGDGAIVRAVEAWMSANVSTPVVAREWTGVELRRGAVIEGTPIDVLHEGVDFRAWEAPPPRDRQPAPQRKPFDLAIGNPPFTHAEAFARRCIELAETTVLLLRLSFLGTEERHEFWQGAGADVHLRVLPNRPSFDGDGTDSASYAWFVWTDPYSALDPAVSVLGLTPEGVRAAQKPAPPRALPQMALDLEEAS